MSNVQNVDVSSQDDGMRLDRWFKNHYPLLGHGQLQKMLRKGQVRLDGARVKTNDRISEGQSIRVPPMPFLDSTPNPDKPVIKKINHERLARDREFLESIMLHMDDDVIVLNKPAGLAVQGGSGTKIHIDGMMEALRDPDTDEKPRLVHRLDKDTSGVFVLARNSKAARSLAESFRSKDAHKLYWAAVAGLPKPDSGKINLALSKAQTSDRSGGREQMVADHDDGKRAITYYKVLERAGKQVSWVALYPQTGRTHQLRVHMNEIGTPIVGDGKYGGELAFPTIGDLSLKLHLHARALRIPHPNGRWFEIVAPLSAHMEETWKNLGFIVGPELDEPEWPEF